MDDEVVTIPRNIKVREVVAYGLSGKQIIYLVLSVGGSLALWACNIPIDLKMAGSAMSISISLFLSLGKAHGQQLDRYIINSIKYPLRQKEFGGDSNAKTPSYTIRYRTE